MIKIFGAAILLFTIAYSHQIFAQTVTVTPSPTPCGEITSSPTPTPTVPPQISPSPNPTVTNSPTVYNNIVISEAMVNPDTSQPEWVEIYNNNNTSVSLNNWFIDDIAGGGSSPRSFTTDIAAKSYYVYELTSAIFNNDGDDVRLLDTTGTVKDSFTYLTSEKSHTWGRIDFNNQQYCVQLPSRGLPNTGCLATEETVVITSPTPSPTNIPTPTRTPTPLKTPTPSHTPTPTTIVLTNTNNTTKKPKLTFIAINDVKSASSSKKIPVSNKPQGNFFKKDDISQNKNPAVIIASTSSVVLSLLSAATTILRIKINLT